MLVFNDFIIPPESKKYVILANELSAFHLCYLPNYANTNVACCIELVSHCFLTSLAYVLKVIQLLWAKHHLKVCAT